MKENTIKIFGSAIFIIVGILFCVSSISLLVNSWQFIKNSIAANGTVVDLVEQKRSDSEGTHYTYSPKVSFTANDGKEYTFVSNLSSSPPSYSPGDKVKILYNPKKPSEARIDNLFNLWGFFLIFFLAGLGCFLIGVIIIILSIKKSKLRKWLKVNGQVVEATVQSIRINNYSKRNSTLYYTIIAQWVQPSSSSAYIFKSDGLRIDPQKYVKPGDKIKVIVDPSNPKRYFVDASFLPVIKN